MGLDPENVAKTATDTAKKEELYSSDDSKGLNDSDINGKDGSGIDEEDGDDKSTSGEDPEDLICGQPVQSRSIAGEMLQLQYGF